MIKIEEVKNTKEKISSFIKETELINSNITKKLGVDLKLKLELNQPIGAFKIRGAMNAVLNLSDQYKGVTCCSRSGRAECVDGTNHLRSADRQNASIPSLIGR